MNVTALDFETYFDQDLTLAKMTIAEYVHDPRFALHGLAICWPDGRAEFRTDVDAALAELQSSFGRDLQQTTIVAHHAQFDLYVLCHVYNLRPRFFIDTMLLAHHVHGRREGAEGESAKLSALAQRYALPRKKDLDFMRGVRHPDARQFAELAAYAECDVKLTTELAARLLPQITRPEVELPVLMHTVRLFTERGVLVDVSGIDRLAAEIRSQVREYLATAGATPEQISQSGTFVSMLEAALARSGRKVPLKMGKKGMIPATAKTDAEMQALLEDDDPVVAALAKARLEKKGEDQKLARLETLRRITHATGGFLPPYLLYCGAHTGRFSGGDGFNIQNLAKKGLGGQVRKLLMARPGHVLVIADLSQVEARITAWLAGQQDMVEAFRRNRDQYSEFAATTFGREVRKVRDDDPPALATQFDAYRMVGKQAVLGLGFGLGALKFMNRLRAEPLAARLFETGDLGPLACRNIVRGYRSQFQRIPCLWRNLEAAAVAAVEGESTTVGQVRFDKTDSVVRCWLPSGRALRYPDLRLEDTARCIRFIDEFGEESEFTPEGPSLVYGHGTGIYGGKFTENIAQAIARDLLVEGVLALEERGVPILFHVHDEIVAEVPENQADDAKHLVAHVFSSAPAWALDLPVACEAKVRIRYEK